MGLSQSIVGFIDESIAAHLSQGVCKRMLEFGNQSILGDFTPERSGKEYYTNRGFEHLSLDLNGKAGALKVDLSKPFTCKEWRSHFDVITNAGTSEHVEPLKGQYQCFKNIHECLRVGGLAIHVVPSAQELAKHGAWDGHCNNYYSEAFFRLLAERNSYSILSMQLLQNLLCVCYRKDSEQEFMRDQSELLGAIVRKRGGRTYRNINDLRLLRPLRPLRGMLKRMAMRLYGVVRCGRTW